VLSGADSCPSLYRLSAFAAFCRSLAFKLHAPRRRTNGGIHSGVNFVCGRATPRPPYAFLRDGFNLPTAVLTGCAFESEYLRQFKANGVDFLSCRSS